MSVSWLSFACFALASAVHFGFFYYEVFVLARKENSSAIKTWAINLGLYNLCLSIGTAVGLYFVLKLQIIVAGVLIGFAGITMIVAGITLWFTAPRLRRFALLQAIPPLIGFAFLTLHVLDRLG